MPTLQTLPLAHSLLSCSHKTMSYAVENAGVILSTIVTFLRFTCVTVITSDFVSFDVDTAGIGGNNGKIGAC